MIDFSLSIEDQHLLDTARDLAREFATRAQEYDEAAAFPAEDFVSIRAAGFHTLAVPKDLGGHGMWRDDRFAIYYMILAELAAGSASTGQLVQIQSHATGIIGYLGNDEQRER
jgi:alkylation response protein AidB-like acyl-CoA dehydrogenase